MVVEVDWRDRVAAVQERTTTAAARLGGRWGGGSVGGDGAAAEPRVGEEKERKIMEWTGPFGVGSWGTDDLDHLGSRSDGGKLTRRVSLSTRGHYHA
jgi:hypothetical protein